MDKKKPPPGATLISRLREGRLKREQELADRKGKGGGADSAVSAQSQPPPVETKPPEPKATGAKAEVKPETPPPPPVKDKPQPTAKAKPARVEAPVENIEVVEAEVVDPGVAVAPEEKPKRKGKSDDVPVEDFSPAAVSVTASHQAGSLIRRSISIADLQPINDDYDLLTEEIKLAGRFAAAGLIAQGLRLGRLKEADIYKQHYPTFEDYCRAEHNMSATYAYRLIRMSEMAERLAQEGTKSIGGHYADSMPDPFEVMLGLGHRHLLALLPLETEAAQELLVKGVPLQKEGTKSSEYIPISKATEQQIREALKLLLPAVARAADKKKPPAVPPARSVRTLRDLVDLLQDWAEWLESEPDPRHFADRIGEGREKSRLVQRLRTLTERIIESI